MKPEMEKQVIKYHTYQYNGDEQRIGVSNLLLSPGDIYCIVNPTQVKVQHCVVNGVVVERFLHQSEYIGDYDIPEFNAVVQQQLNEKHEAQLTVMHYENPNFWMESVTITRG